MTPFAPHSSKIYNVDNFFVIEHESKKRAIYNLYGMSHHSGTLSGGHYVG